MTQRALVVFCHPNPQSFGAHLLAEVTTGLARPGRECRVHDLYAEGFDPAMSLEERLGYHTEGENERPVADYIASLRWCDTIVFVYPTWWFGLPAMLKGWLDRVMVPHATFAMPTEDRPMQPLLHNITTIAAVTTCGATFWQSKFVGEPGRRTLLRGFRYICHPRARTRYAALYRIDSSTPEARTTYAARVRGMMAAL
ncbi:NAD(P)H-dependent oxidoreductase [Acuticoccus mangrovi]|uniref:NAD(P)H-dependent oxidoreductase n=1 Tax=Acuticoccus mangrovi TaxID=2796142 RepID=A0A934IJ43_9HYPH|nr:NAD(P)H-dependent oxidoreductase [Acuticoccus mangrovi]MBJ3775936.1 NAD(P)H-dependent oxidoreductase [Acuticoccus mangrovi]